MQRNKASEVSLKGYGNHGNDCSFFKDTARFKRFKEQEKNKISSNGRDERDLTWADEEVTAATLKTLNNWIQDKLTVRKLKILPLQAGDSKRMMYKVTQNIRPTSSKNSAKQSELEVPNPKGEYGVENLRKKSILPVTQLCQTRAWEKSGHKTKALRLQ